MSRLNDAVSRIRELSRAAETSQRQVRRVRAARRRVYMARRDSLLSRLRENSRRQLQLVQQMSHAELANIVLYI